MVPWWTPGPPRRVNWTFQTLGDSRIVVDGVLGEAATRAPHLKTIAAACQGQLQLLARLGLTDLTTITPAAHAHVLEIENIILRLRDTLAGQTQQNATPVQAAAPPVQH